MIEIMQSIRPEWCSLIFSGYKNIEVRKTRPKCKTPFKVYIYCTKPTFPHEDYIIKKNGLCIEKAFYAGGKVIGEYVCDQVLEYPYIDDGYSSGGDYITITRDGYIKMCLDHNELLTYGDGKTLYGWHISALKIYDTPLELSDFIHPSSGCVNEGKCSGCRFLDRGIDGIIEDYCVADFDTDSYSILKRAPQDWCYVRRIKE